MGKLLIRLAIAGLTFYVMIQALFWPLINKPGTELAWWQNHHAARIGFYVGFPVSEILFHSPFSGTTANHVFAWVVVVAWTGFIYFLFGVVIDLLRKFTSRKP
jgi:hypothetical protein